MAINYGKIRSISFVIPCLNEEKTLGQVLKKISEICKNELKGYATEIILSDNGSTDRSIEIAKQYEVKVEHCEEKGYGSALRNGIEKAKNEVIIFADADDTYDFYESPLLIHELENGYDLVLGSRLNGKIHSGAMPFLHRYIGTPFLNVLINLLYGNRNYKTSDCNSGFRCFRKESFLQWNISSSGMEFASEMLVKAMKLEAKIKDVPISLSPDHPGRKPQLKTWRDGMRHLFRILVDSPRFFSNIGLTIFFINFIILFICLLIPQYEEILGIALFGIHTMMFAMLGTFLGQSIWSVGLYITVKEKIQEGLYCKIINLSEDTVLWLMLGLFSFFCVCFMIIFSYWASNGFMNISLQKQTLFLTAISSNGIVLISNIFTAHLLKRA